MHKQELPRPMPHLQVIEVSVVELLPVPPGEVMWTASFWTGCVHLVGQSWPLPGQHKQLGHHSQDQIPQLLKLWGKKTAFCVVAVQSHYESVIRGFYHYPSQVSCSVFLWTDLHLHSSVSSEPVCFRSRGDTALSPPSKSGIGSTSWWLLWLIQVYLWKVCLNWNIFRVYS